VAHQQVGSGVVEALLYTGESLSVSSPENHNLVHAGRGLELADVFTDLLNLLSLIF
jgi:hypothetical protein